MRGPSRQEPTEDARRVGVADVSLLGTGRGAGRPEAALIGVQYIANDMGEHRAPWVVRPVPSTRWLWKQTGLRAGMPLSNGGIEIDHTASSSPKNVRIVAEMPNVLGGGETAQTTNYESSSGGRVFAAGAFTLGGAIFRPPVEKMVENLWQRLSRNEPNNEEPVVADHVTKG